MALRLGELLVELLLHSLLSLRGRLDDLDPTQELVLIDGAVLILIENRKDLIRRVAEHVHLLRRQRAPLCRVARIPPTWRLMAPLGQGILRFDVIASTRIQEVDLCD